MFIRLSPPAPHFLRVEGSPFRKLLLVALLVSFFQPAFAQSTVPEIQARLKNKPLFLRGCWQGDHLTFDASGKIAEKQGNVSFTVSGFDFGSVRMKNDTLEIRGQRMGLEFDAKGQAKRVPLEWNGYEGSVTIRIEAPRGTDFGPALDAVFAPDLPSLVPLLPVYWSIVGKRIAKQDGSATVQPADYPSGTISGPPSNPPAPALAGVVHHVAKGVKPPLLLKSVNPMFSFPARGLKYSGKVEVYLWVDEAGRPSHLRIMRPAGLGLDEQALSAVSQYTFAPAQQNGIPVKVDLYVDVNFSIF